MHTMQRSPVKTEAASLEFMEFMRQKVKHMIPDHVLNMDQSPIPFTFHLKCTWMKREEKILKDPHLRIHMGHEKGNAGSYLHNE